MAKADSGSIVIDCPVCHRTIWADSRCYHGQVPPPDPEKPPQLPPAAPPGEAQDPPALVPPAAGE